ncbi:MAG: lipopolysaccharide biosynthesis protein [Myxococcota bacterium]|nr:lipopolysaccharide biosynthesis protein [Myxococcota bacterium]
MSPNHSEPPLSLPAARATAEKLLPAQSDGNEAQTAGRGGVAVLGAKLFFLVVGFVQQPLLRVAVGLNDFGGLAQALVVANTVNNVVVASGTQGVSRAVAEARGHEEQALRAALEIHVPLAVVVAIAMVAAAPVYGRFERAEDVVAPLCVLAGVALLYGLYAPLIGYLNGRSRFGRQALLDVTFAALRTAGLIGFGYTFVKNGGSGVLGTTVGWVAATAVIVPLAARSTGLGRRSAGVPQPAGLRTRGAYLAMLGPIAGAQLCTNVLMQIDIALLGRFLSESALSAGLPAEAQRDVVKQWLAIYKECQTFAFLPYQLLFSITLVLFPMVARARADGDHVAVRAYIARGARLAAIFCGLLVGVVVAMPESMLSFAYGAADASRGADVLRTMALAQAAFAMLGIASTVLTSLGRERTSALVTLAAVVAVAIGCSIAVPGATFGHAQLLRSTLASGLALAATLVVAGALVRAEAGAFVPWWTAARVALSLTCCVAIGFVMPHVSRLGTPLVALVVAGGYVAFLVATREIGQADLVMIKALVSRKKS